MLPWRAVGTRAATDNHTTAWLAVAGIGGTFLIAGTFLITRDQHRRRELAWLEAGPGAAAGITGEAEGGHQVPRSHTYRSGSRAVTASLVRRRYCSSCSNVLASAPVDRKADTAAR